MHNSILHQRRQKGELHVPRTDCPQLAISKNYLDAWGYNQWTLYGSHSLQESLETRQTQKNKLGAGVQNMGFFITSAAVHDINLSSLPWPFVLFYRGIKTMLEDHCILTVWPSAICANEGSRIMERIETTYAYEPPMIVGRRVPNSVWSSVLIPVTNSSVWTTLALSFFQ